MGEAGCDEGLLDPFFGLEGFAAVTGQREGEVDACGMKSEAVGDDVSAIDEPLGFSPKGTGLHLGADLLKGVGQGVQFDLEFSTGLEYAAHFAQCCRDVHVGERYSGDDGVEGLVGKWEMLAFRVNEEELRVDRPSLLQGGFIDVYPDHFNLCCVAGYFATKFEFLAQGIT